VLIHKTIAIRPFVAYGAESWTLANKMERGLVMWKSKISEKNTETNI
jgi:hypothetical protein